jgi:hypothetical protein
VARIPGFELFTHRSLTIVFFGRGSSLGRSRCRERLPTHSENRKVKCYDACATQSTASTALAVSVVDSADVILITANKGRGEKTDDADPVFLAVST